MNAPVISLDSYYRDLSELSIAEREKVNFDEPDSLDSELILQQAAALCNGEPILVPTYDFHTHTRAPGRRRIEPGGAAIIEGLFTLYWSPLRALLHTKVYVDLDDTTCYRRRRERDICERGRTVESVQLQYSSTVRPMAERHIWPTRCFADVVVRGDAILEESVAAVLAATAMPKTLKPDS